MKLFDNYKEKKLAKELGFTEAQYMLWLRAQALEISLDDFRLYLRNYKSRLTIEQYAVFLSIQDARLSADQKIRFCVDFYGKLPVSDFASFLEAERCGLSLYQFLEYRDKWSDKMSAEEYSDFLKPQNINSLTEVYLTFLREYEDKLSWKGYLKLLSKKAENEINPPNEEKVPEQVAKRPKTENAPAAVKKIKAAPERTERDSPEKNIKFSDTKTLSELTEHLIRRWKKNPEKFIELRRECGAGVFDAVMAVVMGGAGIAKPQQKAYISLIFNKPEVTPWKANAGLKANRIAGTNYSRRGFFSFPEVDNSRLREEFKDDTTIAEAVNTVGEYPDEYFRGNIKEKPKDPRRLFEETFYRVTLYAYAK